jgi:lysophospholipase L1-like esterase
MKRYSLYITVGILLFLSSVGSNCKKKKKDDTVEPVVDTTLRSYDADNINIQYSGRISFANVKKPKFSAPGVNIKTKFRGTSCTVKFQDEYRYGGSFRNYYNVIIDGVTYLITPVGPGGMQTSYNVASGLTYGEHNVTFVKRTQSEIGNCEFLGFEFKGEILTPDPKPSRKIEIIGNSISCGEGVDATTATDCNNWGIPFHNAYKTFGPMLAKQFNAEYHITGKGGIGVVKNCCGDTVNSTAETMPRRYTRLYLQDAASPVWDVSRFVPDVIILELGTNDFWVTAYSPAAMDSSVLTPVYINFVSTLRGYYPNAEIFCISSPLLGDGYPAGTNNATQLKKSLAGVEGHFQAISDTKVHKIYISNSGSNASANSCWHPNEAGQQIMANEIAPYIQSLLGW